MRTLYVSDLDGTLLNSQSRLSPSTIERLNRLIREKDVLFSIATARTPATVAQLMHEVSTTLPYIVMAGAAFWENGHQEFRDVRTIDNAIIAQLLRIYDAHEINPFVYRQHGNCIYAHHVPAMTAAEQAFIGHRLTSPLKRLFTSPSLSADSPDGAMLVFSMGRYDALSTIAHEIGRQGVACTLMCYHDIFDHQQGYLEIYAQGTTKAAAIRQLAQQTGAGRVVVFGDNLNDLPMMQSADYSLAVSNAFNEVKAKADEIIGSNDEDAVVRWIEKDITNYPL